MIRIGEVIPGLPDHIHRMAAEVLACHGTDQVKLRDHRREKLNSFPERDRAAVREAVNRVIEVRANPGPYKGN